MTVSSDQEEAFRQRLKDDFAFFARNCLKIRPKTGRVIPFELNKVQLKLHGLIEAQKERTGKVRALILKARQEGASTYTEGRYYWKTTHNKGVRAFILTHKDDATLNLFEMAKRFHTNNLPEVRPEATTSNARELTFGLLDSSYHVGTAKADGVGRSDTIQYFHGSEVAFWARADEHAAGVLQAIPDEPGTESILESTANGMGGLFYGMCMAALRGEGEYILVFLPWFEHHEYVKEAPEGWEAPQEFVDYQEAHGITRDQLYWAFIKNGELASAENLPANALCWRFRQEYPATVEEAFRAASTGSFVRSELVAKARKFKAPSQDHAALVFGVDVDGGGKDRTWIIDRQGRQAGRIINERKTYGNQMTIAGRIAKLIDEHKPQAVFIDVGGGYGSGVHDRLHELGYEDIVHGVQFGGGAINERDYANKRAEMWGEMRDWLGDAGGAEIPDDDELHTHICAPEYKRNSNSQYVLEDKDKIRQRLKFSPDGGDALALTFAEPVRKEKRKIVYPKNHISNRVL